MKHTNAKPRLGLWPALLETGLILAFLGLFLNVFVCKPQGIYQDERLITLPFVLLGSRGHERLDGANVQKPMDDGQQPGDVPPETAPAPPTEPTETQPKPKEFQVPVYGQDEGYFDDVLLIGDSRICGLRDYARLGRADYFCDVGATVFSVWGMTASDKGFGSQTLSELLASKNYGKIYISLGLNESGYPLYKVTEGYEKLIGRIQEAQPDAIIVLNSIMTVSREKAASASQFSLENLGKLNQEIAVLADGRQVFYLDANEEFADGEGYLPDEMSADGCHLYGCYYEQWARWLCQSVEELNRQAGEAENQS